MTELWPFVFFHVWCILCPKSVSGGIPVLWTSLVFFFQKNGQNYIHSWHFCLISEPDTVPVTFTESSGTLFQCSECDGLFASMAVFTSHNCTKDKQTEDPLNTDGKGDASCSITSDKCVWGKPETLFLISFFIKTPERSGSWTFDKNTMFDMISKEMCTAGYNYSSTQVTGRWKSLMIAYKAVKDNNKKRGAANKTYKYEDALDEVLLKDPNINPVFTLSSSTPGSLSDSPNVDSSSSSAAELETRYCTYKSGMC